MSLPSDAPFYDPFTFAGHSGEVIKCDLSPDQRTAVTISADNSARIWDIAAACREYNRDASIPRHSGSAEKLALCNGDSVVSAGHDGRAFAWSVVDGGYKGELVAHSAAIKWLCRVGVGKPYFYYRIITLLTLEGLLV